MNPYDDNEIEELEDEELEEIDESEEELEDDYQGSNTYLEDRRETLKDDIINKIKDKKNKENEEIKKRIEDGRQKNLQISQARKNSIPKTGVANNPVEKPDKLVKEELGKQTEKAAKENAKKVASETAKKAGKAVGEAAKKAGEAAASALSKAVASLAANPYFWVVVGVIVLILLIIILFVVIILPATNSNSNNNTSGGNSNGNVVASQLSLTRTTLTKSEFVEACNREADNTTSTVRKSFYNKCGQIYDIARERNFNPEVVVIRAVAEGFSPATSYPSKNNYWGMGCNNGADLSRCTAYSDFQAGVRGFIDNVSQYESAEAMMRRYAYIGDYWYNPGNSGLGGCYYSSYISQYLSSTRASQVANYCSSNNTCSGSSCSPTNSEDQEAYAKYQVSLMVAIGNRVFGRVTSESGLNFTPIYDLRRSKPDWLSRDGRYYNRTINGTNYFQCVWYAKARAIEILSTMQNSNENRVNTAIQAIENSNANGSGWYDLSLGNGTMSIFESSNDINTPRPGAMVSWKWNQSGCLAYNGNNCIEYGGTQINYGHVGIIESVDYNNREVLLSEGWHICSDWNNPYCFGFSSRTISFDEIGSHGGNYIFLGYIYITDYVG